jgi:hypothetical protein
MGSAARKCKVPLVQALKAYGEVVVQIHLFLTWNLMKVSGQPHAPVVLSPGKEPPYSLSRRLAGTQSNFGRLALAEFEPRIVQLVA